MEPQKLITIVGPTASGKTTLGVLLAAILQGEILSGDSRQVYRRMDIGTGKDLSEYTLPDGLSIPYHLIDIEEPGEVFDLYQWHQAFTQAYQQTLQRHRTPILVGGSGLYVETALKGIPLTDAPRNEALRKELERLSHQDLKAILRRFKSSPQTDIGSPRRTLRAIEIAQYYATHPELNTQETTRTIDPQKALPHLLFCIDIPREERIKRIHQRLYKRLEEGLIEEVEGLISSGVPTPILLQYGLEYKYITLYLQGELAREQMVNELEVAIRQFAKRQMTWFRGMERRGFKIHYLDGMLPANKIIEQAIDLITAP